jgi:HEPN domain-containing protein
MCWSSASKTHNAVRPCGELSSSGRSVKDGFWLTPEELEEAGRLLRAARSDLRAAQALAADAEQENDVVGFHAQQAVEKSIKAVLATSGVEIPYTHDLSYLLEIVAEHVAAIPESVAQTRWLTPWAVAIRYGTADARLDRAAAVAVATDAVDWAAAAVSLGPA